MSQIDLSQVATKDTVEAVARRSKVYTDEMTLGVTIPVYLTGAQTFNSNWLSKQPPVYTTETVVDPETQESTEQEVVTYGEPIEPVKDALYYILTEGEYYRQVYTWDGIIYRPALGKINKTDSPKIVVRTYDVTTNPITVNGGQRTSSGLGFTTITTLRCIGGATIDISLRLHGFSTSYVQAVVDDVVVYQANGTFNGDSSQLGNTAHLRSFSGSYKVPVEKDGKTMTIRYRTSNTWPGSDCLIYDVKLHQYADTPADQVREWQPNTVENDGQSGLMPAAAADTPTDAVLTADGNWKPRDEYMNGFVASELDITEEELDEIFAKTSADYSDYSADEDIVGNDFGELRYRRCVTFENNSAVAGEPMEIADATDWNIKHVRKISGIQENEAESRPLQWFHTDGTNVICDNVYYSAATKKFYLSSNRAVATGMSGIVVIEYTKTSGV